LNFLTRIITTEPTSPTLCISPNYDAKNPNSPIASNIILTDETSDRLQNAFFKKEACKSALVLGDATTPRMIRAYMQTPLAGSPDELTKTQQDLARLYPVASQLKQSARPQEVSYPGIKSTKNPHGHINPHRYAIIAHDDFFHKFRTGYTWKRPFERFSKTEDTKHGFANRESTGMSPLNWEINDLDFSQGRKLRTDNNLSPSRRLFYFVKMIEQGASKLETTSRSQLMVISYDMLKSPLAWNKIIASLDFEEQTLDKLIDAHLDHKKSDPNQTEKRNVKFFIKTYQATKKIIEAHPKASIAEIVCRNEYNENNKINNTMFSALEEAKYENVLVLSDNNRLQLRDEWTSIYKNSILESHSLPQSITHICKLISKNRRLNVADIATQKLLQPLAQTHTQLFKALKEIGYDKMGLATPTGELKFSKYWLAIIKDKGQSTKDIARNFEIALYKKAIFLGYDNKDFISEYNENLSLSMTKKHQSLNTKTTKHNVNQQYDALTKLDLDKLIEQLDRLVKSMPRNKQYSPGFLKKPSKHNHKHQNMQIKIDEAKSLMHKKQDWLMSIQKKEGWAKLPRDKQDSVINRYHYQCEVLRTGLLQDFVSYAAYIEKNGKRSKTNLKEFSQHNLTSVPKLPVAIPA
jgi:hypothetical protein